MSTPGYIKGYGIRFANELKTIRKKKETPLQPIYEAITNAWEAILEKYGDENMNLGSITVSIYKNSNAFSAENGILDFDKICIQDNGVGLNEASYERLINLRDDSKHFSNKGTGRIQYLHFFDDTIIESIYQENESLYKQRVVTLSKKDAFLQQNAIMRLESEDVVETSKTGTLVSFKIPLDPVDLDYFRMLKIGDLKEELIKHFLSLFCDNRNSLPKILIQYYANQVETDAVDIKSEDIPEPDREEPFRVNYSQLDGKNIIQTSASEEFSLKAFVQSSEILKENAIYLVSKGERASSIKLDNLYSKDSIAGKRYLFLLSSAYIDNHDRDDRGNIQLITSKDFRNQEEGSLFPEETILLDDIVTETNKTIGSLYHEIEDATQETRKNLDDLQKMFLLNPETVAALRNKIKNTDSDEDILKKIYQSDAEIKARQDAHIKQQLSDIKSILPTDPDYQEKLQSKVEDFVANTPLQNRTALAQYIAHRKLVLDVFDNIMFRVKQGERISENVLHNLIFQQGSSCPEDSDLWLINEEYIYFKGDSDKRLCNIEYCGQKILKDEEDMTDEEKAYKIKCEHDAGDRKPDILLFPQEGKCIIIEFKAPHIDVSNHLHQINRYARLIHNLSLEQYHFTTYYGFLIGENIDIEEIRDSEPEFKSAATLNYIFRPYMPVAAKFGRQDGALYTEIIKYSDLLDRAKLRNKMFIDKLEKGG